MTVGTASGRGFCVRCTVIQTINRLINQGAANAAKGVSLGIFRVDSARAGAQQSHTCRGVWGILNISAATTKLSTRVASPVPRLVAREIEALPLLPEAEALLGECPMTTAASVTAPRSNLP